LLGMICCTTRKQKREPAGSLFCYANNTSAGTPLSSSMIIP
jgi:hypothetical protein